MGPDLEPVSGVRGKAARRIGCGGWVCYLGDKGIPARGEPWLRGFVDFVARESLERARGPFQLHRACFYIGGRSQNRRLRLGNGESNNSVAELRLSNPEMLTIKDNVFWHGKSISVYGRSPWEYFEIRLPEYHICRLTILSRNAVPD